MQVSVALNDWRGMFYDMIQQALTTRVGARRPSSTTASGSSCRLALVGITVAVLNLFFVRHYIFRWRTAMNDYFIAYWPKLRHIEGASQRVQDDTMRFSATMQGLGVSFIDSVMTLIAFLPLLAALSAHVTELPLVGAIPYPLVIAAIVWSLFGTVLLAVVGIKLPGLEFKNQRVEAAFRKELVYGEDDDDARPAADASRAVRQCAQELFHALCPLRLFRRRPLSLPADGQRLCNLDPGADDCGRQDHASASIQQIVSAFTQVASSFQYLVNSWPTIVELISIYKRLRAFEATLEGAPLPDIDQRYLEREQAGLRPEDQPAA